jgi:hypothetical protein
MKKSEAETAIRRLCHEWAKEVHFDPTSGQHPRFSEFKLWLREKKYSHYLVFRALAGADADAERWFDEELKQRRRN